ncbi:MAG: cation diffusion facilitator family transporter [Gemmatimonadota bacterium]
MTTISERGTAPEEQSHSVHAVSATQRGLMLSLLLTGVFFVVELVVGLTIGSVALLADAAHNFSAAAGVGIALIGAVFASKPPTPRRTFGFLRLEILTAWINGVLLLIMAFLIFQMGIGKLLNPVAVSTTPMLILGLVGLVIGGVPAVILWRKQKTDVNVRGAFWHVLETVFGSAAVLVAALLVRFTGWLEADAVLGMLLGPVLLVAAWGIIKGTTKTLLDLAPDDLDLLEVKAAIEAIPEVVDAHHVHAWTVGIGKDIFSAHVRIRDEADPQVILRAITDLIVERFNIYFSTVQLETECTDLPAREIDFA